MKKLVLIGIGMLFTLTVAAQNGLKTGMMAPQFTAKDNTGKSIELKQLLKSHKAVVLFFYRGQWCPYCNLHIKQLQDSLQQLTAKGAYVIGVTPETGENINKTIEKTHASFSMIQDKGYKIMDAYDVKFVMNDDLVNKYKGYGIDLDKNNGNSDHALPVPATYIIDHTGKITFVHFDKDYKKRASVATLLKQL
ncbi:AhpC/TSA family protein [Pedobacter sp. PAMC26386]|nr:AhpC/TSA family protein [Pedobacter sp. PAMC26386]